MTSEHSVLVTDESLFKLCEALYKCSSFICCFQSGNKCKMYSVFFKDGAVGLFNVFFRSNESVLRWWYPL